MTVMTTMPIIFPAAPEICDGLDNNCNSQVDEGLTFTDADGDGYSAIGSCGGSADDCNDNNAGINPGAPEILGDGIDQDCDGKDLLNSYESDCIACHNGWDVINNQLHQSVAAPDGTCVGCHAAKVSTVLPGHYGETVSTDGNNMLAGQIIVCTSCHIPWNNQTQGHTDSNVVWAKVVPTWNGQAYVNLTCDTCHEDRAAFHDNIDHTSLVTTAGTGCDSCHSDPPPMVDAADPKVHNTCNSCHDANGGFRSLAIGKSFAEGGNCSTCHTDTWESTHTIAPDHSGIVTTSGTTCIICHTSTALVDMGDPKVHNSCSTCHNAITGALWSLAAGKSAPGNCTTCHTGRVWSDHTIDHAASGYVTLAANCSTCHDEQQQPVRRLWIRPTTSSMMPVRPVITQTARCRTAGHQAAVRSVTAYR